MQVVCTAIAKGGVPSSRNRLDRRVSCAEGGAASQAVATASARALSEGGEPALAIAHAYAYTIAVFSCPGVKPVIYSAHLNPCLRALPYSAIHDPMDGDCSIQRHLPAFSRSQRGIATLAGGCCQLHAS